MGVRKRRPLLASRAVRDLSKAMAASKRTKSGDVGAGGKSSPKPRAKPDRSSESGAEHGPRGRRSTPLGGFGKQSAAALAAASRAITPVRGLLIAAVGCAALLGLSQFADYRGVAVGVEGYDDVISSVAPAPEVGRAELGTAHSYLMVPAALLAIAILAAAVASGRWRMCRLAALIGGAAVLVSFVVDRPAGLDEGELAQTFADAEAQLLGGFWMQVFAGIGLAATSLLLGAELRKGEPLRSSAGSPRQGRDGSRRERKRSTAARSGQRAKAAKPQEA